MFNEYVLITCRKLRLVKARNSNNCILIKNPPTTKVVIDRMEHRHICQWRHKIGMPLSSRYVIVVLQQNRHGTSAVDSTIFYYTYSKKIQLTLKYDYWPNERMMFVFLRGEYGDYVAFKTQCIYVIDQFFLRRPSECYE